MKSMLFGMCMNQMKKMAGLGDGTNREAEPGMNSNPEGLQRGKEAMERPQKQYEKATGKHKALLIGINYRGGKGELRGCINDVINLKKLLQETYGWSDIRTMTDDSEPMMLPNKDNILREMSRLVEGAEPGDSFWFSYSGHGGQQEDPKGHEVDGMNETLIPLDYQASGMISDNVTNEILIQSLPDGCKMTMVIDACHSGSGADLAYTLSSQGWKEAVNPMHVRCDAVMISGCQDCQTSADAMISGTATGALTHCLTNVLRSNNKLTLPVLMQKLLAELSDGGYAQKSCLTSSQPFNLDRKWDLSTIVPNKNAKLGQIERQKFDPKPNPQAVSFMQNLGVGGLGDLFPMAMAMMSGGGGGGNPMMSMLMQQISGGGGGGGGAMGGAMSMLQKLM